MLIQNHGINIARLAFKISWPDLVRTFSARFYNTRVYFISWSSPSISLINAGNLVLTRISYRVLLVLKAAIGIIVKLFSGSNWE